MTKDPILSRRTVLRTGTLLALSSIAVSHNTISAGDANTLPHQATGLKIGEVTDNSAIVWVRLTTAATRLAGDEIALKLLTRNKDGSADAATLPGACPAASGSVRLQYGQSDDFSDAQVSEWISVTADNDGTHQFQLTSLPPDSIFYVAVECRAADGSKSPTVIRGTFRTAPDATDNIAITGVALGCHLYEKIDHPDGFTSYASVAELKPHFIVQTGDNVYYDRDLGPFSTTIPLARWQWERMFSLPRHRAVHCHTAVYWEKDDHDTLKDDSWPGATFGKLTFEDGLKIFKQQVPSRPLPYRTFRWGKHVQIWLMEGRDFRSQNTMKDGPDKSIWGIEQKAWLKKTMAESDASWKIIISPTPIVGPDRKKKNDNHANDGFKSEGDEIRAWLKQHMADQVMVVNGDRHWQYHSVHPETGLHEFSTGPTSNGLAEGSPGEDKLYHRYHNVQGGFLSFTADQAHNKRTLTVRHHRVDGQIAHEHVFTRPA